jgi:TonB-linked SusC/RagA family outer membrane protein
MTKKVIYYRFWGFLCFLLLITGTGLAQQITTNAVRGIVKSGQGDPLQGVTITVQNKKKSYTTNVISDERGMFSFDNLPQGGPYSFTFSYVGYEERTLDGYSYHHGDVISLSVKLIKVNQALDEVVVVGYGTERRGDLTGAVTQVSGAVLDNRSSPNISRGLEGIIPNLNIVMTDGKPIRNPSYNVRGLTTIGAGGTASALVLIDGASGDPSLLNPNDIESITVLKDAASAAIYGARGAYGVVLITTRSPRKGKVQMNFNTSYSDNRKTVNPQIVNDGYAWATDYNNAYNAWYDYKTPASTINSLFPNTPANFDSLQARTINPSLPKVTVDPATGKYDYYGSTNWYQQLYRNNNPSSDNSLSLSASNDNSDIYISGRAYNQGGIFRYHPDNFTRYNLRLKGNINLASWFTLSDNVDFNAFTYSYPVDNNGISVWRNMDAATSPLAVMFNPDGTLTPQSYSSVGDLYTGNNSTLTKQLFFRNTVSFDADLIKNEVSLKGDFTYAYTNNTLSGIYRPVSYSQGPGQIASSMVNELNQAIAVTNYYATNLYAEAHKHYGRNYIKLLAGLNVEDNRFDSTFVQRDGIIDPSQPNLNLLDGTNYLLTAGGNEWTIMGLFFRANYSYEDKYLVEINGRYDGSSKFPSYSRFGFFPSISAGWVISKESFMDNTKGWLDNLKVRASVGSLGNGQINPYLFNPIMTVQQASGANLISINGVIPTYTSAPTVLPSGLTWEKSTTVDEGVDASFLGNRLNFSFDYYDRYSSGLFTQGQPLPAVFGAAVPNGNNAGLRTAGWEFSPSWRSQITRDLSFSISLPLSDNTSVITKFYNPNGVLPYPYSGTMAPSVYYKGMHPGEIWGFVTQGLFQSQQDINISPSQSYFIVSNSNVLMPGDIKFADIHHLGVINDGQGTLANHGDLKVIGNSTARYLFGLHLRASWKRLSIAGFFQGVGHENWWPGTESGDFWGQYNRPYESVPAYMMKNVYSATNPNAYFPRYRGYVALSETRELAVAQTRYLQNAAYVRLKNLNISYNLPGQWYTRLKMTSARIYFTGQNLFTLTPMHKYARNFDPEVIGSDPETGGNAGNGYDYPMLKTYTFGINVTF